MNGWFILTLILAVGAAIAIPFLLLLPHNTVRSVSVIGVCVVVVFFFFVSSCTAVSTKNVGIETSFGATKGELSNGLHLKAPWYKVTEMNAAIQTDSYTGNTTCLPARIANQ